MKIIGIDGMTGQDLSDELEQGGRFVMYEYCVSIIVMTFKRPSNIYFIRGGHSSLPRGLGFSALSCVTGWWGIPWGPIYTIWALCVNFGGGRDVTREVLASLE